MVLENSHTQKELIATYGQTDVDHYCENDPESIRLVEGARREDRDLTDQERGRLRWQTGRIRPTRLPPDRNWAAAG